MFINVYIYTIVGNFQKYCIGMIPIQYLLSNCIVLVSFKNKLFFSIVSVQNLK